MAIWLFKFMNEEGRCIQETAKLFKSSMSANKLPIAFRWLENENAMVPGILSGRLEIRKEGQPPD